MTIRLTKEPLGRSYLVQAKTADEAIAIAAKIPWARCRCPQVRRLNEQARASTDLRAKLHPQPGAAVRRGAPAVEHGGSDANADEGCVSFRPAWLGGP
jgi:hypothetical protein